MKVNRTNHLLPASLFSLASLIFLSTSHSLMAQDNFVPSKGAKKSTPKVYPKEYYEIKEIKLKALTPDEELLYDLDENAFLGRERFSELKIVYNPKDKKTYKIPSGVPYIVDDIVGDMEDEKSPDPSNETTTGGIIGVVDQLIAIGQKIIPTIKEGKPVVTQANMTAIAVLPKIDGNDPQNFEMANWSIPSSKYFKITMQNKLGVEVVNFIFGVMYQYGGNVNEKGKYLAGVRAFAKNINVKWGYDLSASSQLVNISNVGTVANPIAGASIDMNVVISNVFFHNSQTYSFFIKGDGTLLKL